MKHLFGLLACIAAVALAIGVTRYFSPPKPEPAPSPPVDTAEREEPSRQPAGRIAVQVVSVTLDRATQRSTTVVDATYNGPDRVPDAVWGWTYFVAPNAGPFSGEPIKAAWPDETSRTARLTFTSFEPWLGTPEDPGGIVFFAKAYVSPRSAAEAVRPSSEQKRDLDDAVPVVVKAARDSESNGLPTNYPPTKRSS